MESKEAEVGRGSTPVSSWATVVCVFVYSCSIEDYDERLQAIRSVAGGKPVRFVAAFCDRLDLS